MKKSVILFNLSNKLSVLTEASHAPAGNTSGKLEPGI